VATTRLAGGEGSAREYAITDGSTFFTEDGQITALTLTDYLKGPEQFQILCGVDIVELARFRHHLNLGGARFLGRVFTNQEIAYCESQPERLAARFAGKEAVAKALGTGIRSIGWTEIEILSDRTGKPSLALRGRAAARASQLGVRRWAISLSHGVDLAIAYVVALCEGGERNE
jgi:holo-[acyl-carrier protein] synthase